MITIGTEMIDDLEALSDDELRVTIAEANKLLDERDKKRKEEARERARAIMADAGLSFPEERKKPGRKRAG